MGSRRISFSLNFTTALWDVKCSHEKCSPTSKCSSEKFLVHLSEKQFEHFRQTLFANMVCFGLCPAFLFSEYTTIIFLNQMISVIVKCCFFFDVQSEILNSIQTSFDIKVLITPTHSSIITYSIGQADRPIRLQN